MQSSAININYMLVDVYKLMFEVCTMETIVTDYIENVYFTVTVSWEYMLASFSRIHL